MLGYGADRTEIDDYGRIYGVGDITYDALLDAVDNGACEVHNIIC